MIVQQARQSPVTGMSVTKDIKFLLVTVASSENVYLFKITDTFGTVTPYRLVFYLKTLGHRIMFKVLNDNKT